MSAGSSRGRASPNSRHSLGPIAVDGCLPICLRSARLRLVSSRPSFFGSAFRAFNISPVSGRNRCCKQPQAGRLREGSRRYAYFVLFCPARAAIVTTNVRDIQPMADTLGIEVETP
jgi:hypothetical protein